jgi:hypothetical protein
MVFAKFLPHGLYSHAVRTIDEFPGQAAKTLFSPSAFVRPYADRGSNNASISQGALFSPEKT